MAVSSSIFYTPNISSSFLMVTTASGYSINSINGTLSSGSDVSFNWGTRTIYDSNKISSINWQARALYDNSGNLILGYNDINLSDGARLYGTASYALNGPGVSESDPIFVSVSASLATTGSNHFKADQIISGSIILAISTPPAPMAGALYFDGTNLYLGV